MRSIVIVIVVVVEGTCLTTNDLPLLTVIVAVVLLLVLETVVPFDTNVTIEPSLAFALTLTVEFGFATQ